MGTDETRMGKTRPERDALLNSPTQERMSNVQRSTFNAQRPTSNVQRGEGRKAQGESNGGSATETQRLGVDASMAEAARGGTGAPYQPPSFFHTLKTKNGEILPRAFDAATLPEEFKHVTFMGWDHAVSRAIFASRNRRSSASFSRKVCLVRKSSLADANGIATPSIVNT